MMDRDDDGPTLQEVLAYLQSTGQAIPPAQLQAIQAQLLAQQQQAQQSAVLPMQQSLQPAFLANLAPAPQQQPAQSQQAAFQLQQAAAQQQQRNALEQQMQAQIAARLQGGHLDQDMLQALLMQQDRQAQQAAQQAHQQQQQDLSRMFLDRLSASPAGALSLLSASSAPKPAPAHTPPQFPGSSSSAASSGPSPTAMSQSATSVPSMSSPSLSAGGASSPATMSFGSDSASALQQAAAAAGLKLTQGAAFIQTPAINGLQGAAFQLPAGLSPVGIVAGPGGAANCVPFFIPKQFPEVKTTRRRENHSEVERRRRDLINERIEELRRIVPETSGSQANKATVLGKAIDHLNILADENAKLQKDKETLMQELDKLRVLSLSEAGPSESAAAKRKRRLAEDGRPDGFIDSVTAQRVNYEPIATIGAVQSYGVLVAIRDTDWTVSQVSSNVEALVSIPADQLLNQHISALFDEESVRIIQSVVGDEGEVRVTSPVLLSTIRRDNGERVIWDGIFHRASSCIVLELEPFSRDITLVFSDSGRIRAALENLENASGVEELSQILAHEVSDITGFDRVMVYKFGAEGHGKVLAEVLKKEGLEPYLGLNFPATDIPTVARNLFVLNRVRVIADSFGKPSEVTPAMSPVTERPLDMSKSVLRAVSRCHTQYLKNMGVAASISNAIVKDKKLWGLFICYSYSPKRLSYEHREACILLSRVLSALLARKEQQDVRQHIGRAKEIQSQFLDQLLVEGRFPEGLYAGRPNVFDILDCGGAAVYTRARGLVTFGRTPSAIDLRDLIEWLNSNMTDDVWSTDCLSEHFEGAAFMRDVASGLMAVSLSHFPGDYVLWFRPEVIQEENWGGPLKDAIIRGENGSLNPRASFQRFVQLVKGKAVAFSQRDMTCARALRMTVLDVAAVAPQLESAAPGQMPGGREESLRRLHEKLEHAGNELLGIFQQEVDGLVETMPLPLIAVDRDYRVTDWNLMASKLTGYPRAELIGAPLLERALGRDQQAAVRDLFDRIIMDAQGGTPASPARPFSSLSVASPSLAAFGPSPTEFARGGLDAVHTVGAEIATVVRTKRGHMAVTLYAAPRRDADGNAIGVIAILHPVDVQGGRSAASIGSEAFAARQVSHSVLFELVKKWLPCFNAVHIATSMKGTQPGTPAMPSSVASSPSQHLLPC